MRLVVIFDAGMQIATNSIPGLVTFSSRKRVVHLVKRQKKTKKNIYIIHAVHCAISHRVLRGLPWKFTKESAIYVLAYLNLTPYKGHQNGRNLHFHASLAWSSSVVPPSADGMKVEANPQ